MSSPATHADALRPLTHGERIGTDEFDVRYEVTQGKSELVGGVVHVGSPPSFDHEAYAFLVRLWLGTYAAGRPDVGATGSPTVHLPNGGRVEPDALLRRLGGDAATRVVGKGKESRLHGAPELVVEVAISTLDEDVDDTHGKRADYRESGVIEYLVIAPTLDAVHWWRLDTHVEPTRWVPMHADEHGVIESHTFSGLRLHVEAVLALDDSRVLSVLAG